MFTRHCLAISIAAAFVVYCAGCGGGSSGSGTQAGTVTINSQSLSPFRVQIKPGNIVTWVNNDSQSHYVISGTLAMVPVSQRQTHRIFIDQNNTFTPPSLTANFGDTIEWQNNRATTYALNLIDQYRNTLATLAFAQGQVIPVNSFQSAGIYYYEQADISSIFGILRLTGVGVPDNQFQSQLLPTGGQFTRQFFSVGTFNYYVTSPLNPNTSFLTGQVVVQ
jgi:plastocyanin